MWANNGSAGLYLDDQLRRENGFCGVLDFPAESIYEVTHSLTKSLI